MFGVYINFVLFVCLCYNLNSFVSGAYFSMTNIELNLPSDRSRYPPENHALVTLFALPERHENDTLFRYSLTENPDKYFQIFANTGDLMFTQKLFRGKFKGGFNISTNVGVESGWNEKDITSFQVNFLPLEELDCNQMLNDLCYWQSVDYRIYENRRAGFIGSLASPYLLDICKGFHINYTIITGGNQIEVSRPTKTTPSWMLRTKGSLERDVIKTIKSGRKSYELSGELVQFAVSCSITNTAGITKGISKNFTLRVLDENDNLPESQDVGDIYVKLKSNFTTKGEKVSLKHIETHNDFLLIDRDSSAVNNHSFEIINDPLQIVKPECKTFDEDVHDEPQTVINCGLIFTRNTHIPRFPYIVVLQINDTSFVKDGHESVIRIPIHLHNSDTISKHPSSMTSTTPRVKPKPLILYPHHEVSIFRSATPYARITQPKKSISNCTSFLFTLTNSSYFKAFGITQTEGIIYVNNTAVLKDSPKLVTINVQWFKGNMLQMDEIVVNLVEDPSHTCANVKNGNQHCADFSKSKQCLAACGLATGGSNSVKNRKRGGPRRCMWKDDDLESNLVDTAHYNTCTPDIETCPNAICDSLEQVNYLICPQDCTDRPVFPVVLNTKTGRGIWKGFGVCTCDDTGSCVCSINNKRDNKTTHKKTDELLLVSNETSTGNLLSLFTPPSLNLSRRTGLEIATCGTGCLLGILAGGIFLVAAVAAVVACWRFDRVHKTRDKFSDENNDLSAPLSDYVDRGVIPDPGFTLNFDMTTSLSQQSANKMTPDSKWEFPRNQLVVEQTLGEGEFGRVLRARAKDISGQPGYTIVAVKTLKDDAREAELLDLLSEYQLLKEVSHPNIIRLLGASTAPGGPVYLIIEFAQYGSLRSYLRRSRHLKSESRPPISARLEENAIPRNDNYDEPKHCKVTPTDILSFAWQISNGMSYLTDIKLVHRDLAARNVLLTENKVCKISDFGLTRDIYEDDAYFKRSKGRVPVKWMAPESLSDHVYTSKSDVWSFGILTWELVTLGATPYPGIQVQNLFHLLKSGYRMERPEHCTTALYKMMRSCWHIDPHQRPTFHELSDKWEKMLSDQVEYLDLTPNAIHNRSYFYSINDNEENLPQTNSKDESDDEDGIEDNLHNNSEEPKCSASQKLLEEPELASTSHVGDVSPAKSQGYETPVKVVHKSEEAKTPSNENPQYYTNMEAFENVKH